MTTSNCIHVKNRKEMDNMSIAGMILSHEGIIAFADSKASLLTNDIVTEDKDRNPQKILKSNDLIVVTTGNNYYINYNYHYIKIEELLSSLISQYSNSSSSIYKNVERFVEKLSVVLKMSVINLQFQYDFLIGLKKGDCYQYIYVKLDEKSYNNNSFIKEKHYSILHQYIFQYIGDKQYTTLLGHIPFTKSYSFQRLYKEFPTFLSHIIQAIDISNDYNYVGLPIHIEILQ